MSIEQKIAEILAESKKTQLTEQTQSDEVFAEEEVKPAAKTPNPDNAKNAVVDEKEAEGGTNKKANRATQSAAAGDQSVINTVKEDIELDESTYASADQAKNVVAALKQKHNDGNYSVKQTRNGHKVVHAYDSDAKVKTAIRSVTERSVTEDVDALMNGEELSEEFRSKATAIFEAAVMNRVKDEVARLEEEFEAKLDESLAQNVEGLVEQVDGYLGYIAEQWMTQNELALERGMKSEILEGFVSGLKDLFEEHYIDIPEEKLDVLGEMEQALEELETKLNEQVAANIEMAKTISEQKRNEVVKEVSEGLTDTETEKFNALVEELSYEDSESFENKVKTIRENYFTTKVMTEVKSVVTDAPVEVLTEDKKISIDPVMAKYLSALNNK